MANKKRERHSLDVFLRSRPELAGLGIEEGQPPAPDFILGGRIGIEVSEILRDRGKDGSKRKMQEELRNRVVGAAEQRWKSMERPPIEVQVVFAPEQPLKKDTVHPVEEKLVQIVESHLPTEGGEVVLSHETLHPSEWNQLLQEVRCVRISRKEESVGRGWWIPDSDFIPPLEPSLVQSEIDAKNPKVGIYRQHTSEVLLLLAIEDFRLSGTFVIPERAIQHEYETAFDRVFLVNLRSEQVVELGIAGKTDPLPVGD